MPRYKMTDEQMADLVAYLKKIGKESDAHPGLSEDTIKMSGRVVPTTSDK
jgi:hypothetical protein